MEAIQLVIRSGASLSEAKLAYFEGDFERCLTLCYEIRSRSVATTSEVALLTARAYLRSGEPGEAERTLQGTIHPSLDSSLTAKCLLATARIRLGDADDALTLLSEAATRSANAHLSIRAELLFTRALAYWAKRDVDAAEAALAEVDPRSGIIYARTLELRGWCYDARGDYREAAAHFRAVLQHFDTCGTHDQAIKATALCSLSIYAAELFDADLAACAATFAKSMIWSNGLAGHHILFLAHQALYEEFAGNTTKAFSLAMAVTDLAATLAMRVAADGLVANISRHAGEFFTARNHAVHAGSLLETIDIKSDLVGEDRFSILVLAENYASFDLAYAKTLFAQYWSLMPADKMLALTGTSRVAGEELFVAGVLQDAADDRVEAATSYRKAFRIFKEIGYRRRALIAGVALVMLDGDDEAWQYLVTNLNQTTNFLTTSIDSRRADWRSMHFQDR